ncbi:cell wall biogenesis protein [Aspergillus sclerotialis]|uniref:Cell wall biogenesis protein n=1 Tax=Aspergillus sclerotialis TaxID=2070753 RepID=A0A3A2ZGD8_9EURO|nr:cell wall biogenesis protein [Aspergillus sclerotialis]
MSFSPAATTTTAASNVAPSVTAPTATTPAATAPALATPSRCTADFSLIPIGTQSTSYSQTIANVERLVQQSGLRFQMHATGTTLEGPWDQVVQVIGFAHTLVHQQGVARIQTDIRISTRTDKVQPMEGNVASVERILSAG